ncbi:MAG: LysR family transcriptional regulator [Clostridia bacterium]|nr:LysR family transcriptional regulator [Clostridia bacterium]
MIEKLSLYRSFLAAAREGSISAGARALYVSQPALSADIRALEEELGVKLFFRASRGITLTPEGELLEGYVRSAFSLLEAGEDRLRDLHGLRGGHLRIGASDMTLRFFLLDHIATFRARYPDVKLSVTNNPTPETLRALRAGKIDFGVISEPLDEEYDDLIYVPVRELRDIFVCAPSHPLADQAEVSPDALAKEPLIMLEANTSTRRYLNTQPGYTNLVPAIELATSDLILEFARRGIGVAAIVEDFAREAIDAGELCQLKLTSPPAPRRMLLIHQRNLPLPAAARRFIEESGIEQA